MPPISSSRGRGSTSGSLAALGMDPRDATAVSPKPPEVLPFEPDAPSGLPVLLPWEPPATSQVQSPQLPPQPKETDPPTSATTATVGASWATKATSPTSASAAMEETDERMNLSTKLLFSLGESVQGIYITLAGIYLNSYLLEVCCLDPASVAMIQLVQGMFDAVNDPFIGYMSDKTRTRWGRRRPWLFIGGPFLALFYFCLWNALPNDLNKVAKVAYYMVCYMGVSIGVTCVSVQISSLPAELTTDYNDRTEVGFFRVGAVAVSAVLCALIHGGIAALIDEQATSYRVSGGVFALTMLAFTWIFVARVRERFVPGQESPEQFSLFKGLSTLFQNKAFGCVVLIYLLGPTAIVMVQTNSLLFCKYVIGDESLLTVMILCVQGCALLSAPFWIYVSKTFSKRHMYFFGGPPLSVGIGLLYFCESAVSAVPTSMLIGFSLGICYFVPYSMLPDVMDSDELQTGKRREGLFSGFFTVALKLSTTIAVTLTNALLKMSGYEKPSSTCSAGGNTHHPGSQLPDVQSDAVLQIIKIMISPVPALLVLIAMLAIYAYPITKAKHCAMVAQAKIKRTHCLESINN